MSELPTFHLTPEQLSAMPLEDIVPLLNPDTVLDIIFKLDENRLSVSERDPDTGEWINPDGTYM